MLCRLIDKAFEEYNAARQYIEEEIKSGNKLEFMFAIINHLENCINATNRTAKTFESAESNGIFQLMSEDCKNKIRSRNVSRFEKDGAHRARHSRRQDSRFSFPYIRHELRKSL